MSFQNNQDQQFEQEQYFENQLRFKQQQGQFGDKQAGFRSEEVENKDEEIETKQDSNSHKSQDMETKNNNNLIQLNGRRELDTAQENLYTRQRVEIIAQEINEVYRGSGQDLIDYFYNRFIVQNTELIDLEELKESPNLRIKKFKQSVYFGEILNEQRCGKGIMVYLNGRIYEGEWFNDKRFGKGYEIYPNGNRYEGQFINGKPEGMGTFLWQNGEIYDGQWSQGMKHGSGMWRGITGDSYLGEWKQDKADGYGVHTWVNGDRYEGQFKNSLKHGDGAEKYQNGDYYTGQYVNGRPEGNGEYIFSNGSCYKGQFKNGLRHGKGIWKRGLGPNVDKYEGEYKNDKKCGYGVFTWESGNYYKGNFFNDLRHGYGEMYWNDGSFYKGMWEKGIQNGEGELSIPGEDLRKGLFINNNFHFEEEQENQNSLGQFQFQDYQEKFDEGLIRNKSFELIDEQEDEQYPSARGVQKKQDFAQSSSKKKSGQKSDQKREFSKNNFYYDEEDDKNENGQESQLKLQKTKFKQPDMSSTDQLPVRKAQSNKKKDSKEESLVQLLGKNVGNPRKGGQAYAPPQPEQGQQKKIKRNISSTSEKTISGTEDQKRFRSQSHQQSPIPYIRTYSKQNKERKISETKNAQKSFIRQDEDEDDLVSLEKKFQKNFNHYSKSVRNKDSALVREQLFLPSIQNKKKFQTPKNLLANKQTTEGNENSYYQSRKGKQTSPDINYNNFNTQEINHLKRSISATGERVQTENKAIQASLGNNYAQIYQPNKNRKIHKNQLPYLQKVKPPSLPIKNKKIREKSPVGQGLLDKHEFILWQKYQNRFLVKKGLYDDLYDPIVVNNVRKLIHPPVWKPIGRKSDYTPPKRVINSPNQKQSNQNNFNPNQQMLSRHLYVPKPRNNLIN